MTRHAFVDESKTGDYVVVAAVLPAGELAGVRKVVRGLLLGNQRRIHFAKERAARKQQIIDSISATSVTARVYVTPNNRDARRVAFTRMVADLSGLDVTRMVWERDDSVLVGDQRDLYTATRKARPGEPDWLDYHAMRAHEEPLLALPDAIAWCWAAGGQWRRQVEPSQTRSTHDARSPARSPSGELPGSLPRATALGTYSVLAELYVYPGDQHLFVDSSLPSYDPDAAALAMQRSREFLDRLG